MGNPLWPCRAAGCTDNAHRRRLLSLARQPAASTSRPVGNEKRMLAPRHVSPSGEGRKLCCPAVTLDFHVLHSDQSLRPRRLRRPRAASPQHPPSTIALRSRTTVLLAGTSTRLGTLATPATQEVRANHNGTITAYTDRSISLAFTKTISEPTSSPILLPIGSTARVVGHARVSARV